MSEYESKVRRTLWQMFFCLAVAAFSLFLGIYYALCFDGQALKLGLALCGAMMAMAVLIGQNRSTHFSALLTPNTFVDANFIRVRSKYQKYQRLGSRSLLLMALVGILGGTYRSLI